MDADGVDAPVTARGVDADESAGRFQDHHRLGLGHRQNAGFEQHRRDAEAVRPRHRRRVLGLHDDEAHGGARVLWRHQQIDVAEDSAPRLVQHEAAQRLVAGDEAGLLPERVAGRRGDAADDDIAHLAFRMAADDLHQALRAHRSIHGSYGCGAGPQARTVAHGRPPGNDGLLDLAMRISQILGSFRGCAPNRRRLLAWAPERWLARLAPDPAF